MASIFNKYVFPCKTPKRIIVNVMLIPRESTLLRNAT
jgi:hypothetical protein